MRRKVKVTYSVEYIQEIELEVSEETNEILESGKVIDWNKYDDEYIWLANQDETLNLPIPTLVEFDSKFGQEFKKVEYVDGSFDVKSFEL